MNRKLQPLAAFTLILLGAAVAAWGCGPFFPDDYLISGNEQRVLAIPEGRFDYELARALKLPRATAFAPAPLTADPAQASHWLATQDADRADLKAALIAKGLAPERVSALFYDYNRLRSAIKNDADSTEEDFSFNEKMTLPPATPFDLAPHQALLDAIPAEFALYLRGAAAYRANQYTSATAHWIALLKLPPGQRQHRSTWAAFMLGKTALVTSAALAIPHFEQTRALAVAGFRDSLGLARDSLGWQARAERKSGRPVEALHHYAELARLGVCNPDRLPMSFRVVCADILTSLPLHKAVFQDPEARRLLTAWVATRATPGQAGAWRKALLASAVKLEPAETDQMAWTAYRAGKIAEAQEWIARSPAHTPVGSWVQSKLLLRQGKIEEGMKVLKGLTPLLPQDEEWLSGDYNRTAPRQDAQAEIGVLLLGRQDYLSALDAFARSGYWEDAAYIAERVLTVKELESYLRSRRDDEALSATRFLSWGSDKVYPRLRYLLARRLARAGEWKRAHPYYPPVLVPVFDDYVGALKTGRDAALPKRKRAEALYRAGMIARQYGMELMGSENEPDWTQYDGQFERVEGSRSRLLDKATSLPLELRQPALVKALSASADEKRRLKAHKVTPEKRWHYRYTASNLMWECARLLPDNDPLTAAALYYGGAWHKDRDDAFADKFYQALVRRCARLPIAQEADKIRWFPATPPPSPQVQIVKPGSEE